MLRLDTLRGTRDPGPASVPCAHRQFLTDEEFAELLRRLMLVLPDGPLVDWREAFRSEPSKN